MIKSIIIRRPFYNGKQKEGRLQTQTDESMLVMMSPTIEMVPSHQTKVILKTSHRSDRDLLHPKGAEIPRTL